MTTKTKAKEATKQRDPKFRVIPNLSLRGKDIMTRYKNGTLRMTLEGQYSINEKIDESRRMTKQDIINAARDNNSKIEGYKLNLEKLKQTNG